MTTKEQLNRVAVSENKKEYKHLSDSIKSTESKKYINKTDVLVGTVDEFLRDEETNRIPVRWQHYDGHQVSGKLLFLEGLNLSPGDQVIISSPGNFPERIITGVLKQAPSDSARQAPDATPVVTVDGNRIEISGKDEIVLRCGDASITMRRNGRIVIKGKYVESRSSGTNRVKGGSVLIN